MWRIIIKCMTKPGWGETPRNEWKCVRIHKKHPTRWIEQWSCSIRKEPTWLTTKPLTSCSVIMCRVCRDSINHKCFKINIEAKQECVFTVCGCYGYPLCIIYYFRMRWLRGNYHYVTWRQRVRTQRPQRAIFILFVTFKTFWNLIQDYDFLVSREDICFKPWHK